MPIRFTKKIGQNNKEYSLYTKEEIDHVLSKSRRFTERAQTILGGGGNIGKLELNLNELDGKLDDLETSLTNLGTSLTDLDTYLGDLETDLANKLDDLPGEITETLIADNAVTTPKIIANAVTANEIAAGTITANEIAANTITANEIFADTITANEIAAGTITSNEILADTITANEIAADTITANELNIDTLNSITVNTGDLTISGTLTWGGGNISPNGVLINSAQAFGSDTSFIFDGGGSTEVRFYANYVPSDNMIVHLEHTGTPGLSTFDITGLDVNILEDLNVTGETNLSVVDFDGDVSVNKLFKFSKTGKTIDTNGLLSIADGDSSRMRISSNSGTTDTLVGLRRNGGSFSSADDGMVLILEAASGHSITIDDGFDNIDLGNDVTLGDQDRDILMLIYSFDDNNWKSTNVIP